MQRTVALRLHPIPEQRAALHHVAYDPVRQGTALGSQTACNALRWIADAYKVLKRGAGAVVREDLTYIRRRLRAGKRVRSRLRRWAWAQLQTFVRYKAEAAGIRVLYVNPAYTSRTCSVCGSAGQRSKHRFRCSTCGSQQHSDTRGAQNLCGLASSAGGVTGAVNRPHGSTPRR